MSVKEHIELTNFIVWLNGEYMDYGDTASTIARLAKTYNDKGHLEYFIEYIKEHFNNVFSDPDEFEDQVNSRAIYKLLSGEAKDVLSQIVASPRFDGDVVSKSGKYELYNHNLILRIANGGEFGDNAANYMGYLVWELYNED